MPAAPAPTAGTPRRLRTIVPAPVTMLRSDPGAPDGLDVLEDVERVLGLPEDDSLALFLWLTVRRVFTWAAVPAQERERLRGRGTTIRQYRAEVRRRVPELAAALRIIPALWTRPDRVETAKVADACDQVGRWAAEWGLMRTAGMFLEAAAAAEPENALRAMDAGLMCQRLGGTEMMQRAEQWHQRAFGLARVARKSRRLLTIRALLAYGNWAREAGEYPLARRCYEKAARRARRYERWTYYAVAHHNLFFLSFLAGAGFASVETHARIALEHYPRGHERLPVLAHDYAVLLNQHRFYRPALQLLENLPPLIEQPEIRLLAYSSLALAAAGTGGRDVFQQATRTALSLCPLYEDFAPNALVRISEGALLLGLREHARRFARRGLTLASDRADADAAAAAEQILAMCQEAGVPTSAPNVVPETTTWLLAQFVGALPRLQPTIVAVSPNAPAGAAEVRTRTRPLPPAPHWPLWGGAESTSALAVLQEVESGVELPQNRSLSLVLWMALRSVHKWADATAEQRAGLFSDANGTIREHLLFFRARIAELRDALGALATLYQAPELLECAQVADAYDQVGRWAANTGWIRTAILFMEAAAAAEPENALRAMDAGLMCQRMGGPGLMTRAELWHQRAFALAQVAKGRRLLTIRALLAYGNWALAAADYPLAQACYQKAARRARRHSRRTYYAIAHHNLLFLSFLTGADFATAEAHVQTAVDHYPQGHERIPVLAHDYAVLLNRHGVYSVAFRLLEHLPPLIEQPEIRLIAYSSLALAAAGTGRRAVFEQAVHDALPLCPLYGDFAANALVQLAEGARLCGDYERAAEYAEAAHELGTARSDADVVEAAARLRDRIAMKEPALLKMDVPAPSRIEPLQRSLRSRIARIRARRQSGS